MSVAVYAGSFDPFTNGHLDILKRSTEVFDKVIVAIAYNPDKKCILTYEERVDLIRKCTKKFSNVEVYSFDGLTVDFAKKHNASVLIRGLRNSSDFEFENQLAQVNLSLNNNIQTFFMVSKPEYSFISSSVVRELIMHKCDLKDFVPPEAAKYLRKKFNY